MADQFYDRDISKYNKRVTYGWGLDVKWKGGSKYWLNISVLKNNKPLDVERYEVENNIGYESPLECWYQYILKNPKIITPKEKVVRSIKSDIGLNMG